MGILLRKKAMGTIPYGMVHATATGVDQAESRIYVVQSEPWKKYASKSPNLEGFNSHVRRVTDD